MKLCFNEATCMKRSTLEKDLMLCEKYGYDLIEIRLDMLGNYLKRHTIDDLREFFRRSRLKPWAFNSIEDINFCTEKQWQKVVELLRFGCEMSEKIGNPYLVVVPTAGDGMISKTEEEVFEDSVDVLNRLADVAKPYGVKLAFEPIGGPRWCVRSLEQCWKIVKRVDREEVGIALDAFNLYLFDRLNDIDILDFIPSEKIFVYHIDDCEDRPLEILDQCHRLFPGDGVIPLHRITEKLKAKHYKGAASVELFRPEYWERDPEQIIRISAGKARPYL